MQKIIERVRKLLALAGNNSNENEALVALEKAHALLAEYNLSIAEIRADNEAVTKRVRERTETNMSESYYRSIWDKVGRLYYCSVTYIRPSPYKRQTFYSVVGREANVILATEFALYLCQTMKRLMNEACKQMGRKDNAFRESFLKGITYRLWQRMDELEKQPATDFGASSATALVLYRGQEIKDAEAWFEENFGKIRMAKRKKTEIKDHEGWWAGDEAGETVSFDRQVKDATVKRKKIA